MKSTSETKLDRTQRQTEKIDGKRDNSRGKFKTQGDRKERFKKFIFVLTFTFKLNT